jgi:hypothetical protein
MPRINLESRGLLMKLGEYDTGRWKKEEGKRMVEKSLSTEFSITYEEETRIFPVLVIVRVFIFRKHSF